VEQAAANPVDARVTNERAAACVTGSTYCAPVRTSVRELFANLDR